jgi:arylsulfatase A-like enzyme
MKNEQLGVVSRRQMLAASAAAAGLQAAQQTPVVARTAAPSDRDARLKTPLPKANGLNLIVIIADTTRCDRLGAYGSQRVRTPNLDRLAAEGVLFENAYADGLPTIPCRRVYHTGRSVLHEKEPWWRPLYDEDVTLAEVLGRHRFNTAFIVDTFHHFRPGMNFHRGYRSFQWIRGQESDRWISGPRAKFDPSLHMPQHLMNPQYRENMVQFMMNTSMRKGEDDYFCAQSSKAAADWLEQNGGQKPFMLWLDMFDPHEPWDAPPRFRKMYRDNNGYERFLFGYGVRNADIRETDYPILQDLYAAEVTFSDHCIGRLLDKIDAFGLRDDTIVVFSTDHGTHLGELGCVQKTAGLLNSCVAHVPLIVRHPDRKYAGRRVKEFVSAVDFMPSLLTMLGLTGFPGMDGKNFWSLVKPGANRNHERVFTGFDNFAAVRDRKWHYFQSYRGLRAGEAGTAQGKGPALYDLESDPGETKNVVDLHPNVVQERRALLADRFQTTLPGA